MSQPPRSIADELGMDDAESRRVAAQRLARVRGEEVTALLLRALADDDWRVRKEAAGAAPAIEPRDAVVAALLSALAERENIGLRNAAVEALVAIGPDSVGPATAALAHLDADGRKLAVEILGGIPHPQGAAALEGALRDADPNVRAAAAEALGTASAAGEEAHRRATSALMRALAEDAPLVKLAAIDALVRLDADVPWSIFEPFLADPLLRRRAIAAAGRSTEEAALLALAQAAGDPSAPTARDAVVALADRLFAHPGPPQALSRARERIASSRRAMDVVRKLASEADDPRGRGAALVILGLLGNRHDVPLLVAALEDEEIAPRAELALRLFGAPAIEPALEAGRDSVAPVRAATLSLVPMMAVPAEPFALSALREALSDPNPEVIVAAMNSLATLGSEEDLRAASSFATTFDARIAGTACAALKSLSLRYPAAARRLLEDMTATGPSAVVGCVIIEALAESGASEGAIQPNDLSYLRAALDHGEVRVRRAAVDALARVADHGAAEAVAFALADEEEDVVLAAVRALGRMRKPAPLMTLLRTTHKPGVVATTLLTLRDASPDDAFDAARPLLTRSDPILACAAIEAIGQLAGPRRDEALRLALEHPVAEVVTMALAELARGEGEHVWGRVRDCLDHESADVRRVAAELLGEEGSHTAHAALRSRLERETEPRVREAISDALSVRPSRSELP